MGKEIVKWIPTNQKMPKKGSNTIVTFKIENAWFEQKNNSETNREVDTYMAHAFFNEKGVWELDFGYNPVHYGGSEPWEDDCDMAFVEKQDFSPFGNRYYELRENKKSILRRFIDIIAWIYAPIYPYGISWDFLKQETKYLIYEDDYGLSEWHEQVIGYIGVDNKKFRQEVSSKISEIKNGLFDEILFAPIEDMIIDMENWLNLYDYISNNKEGIS